jgi:hypothetical protein
VRIQELLRIKDLVTDFAVMIRPAMFLEQVFQYSLKSSEGLMIASTAQTRMLSAWIVLWIERGGRTKVYWDPFWRRKLRFEVENQCTLPLSVIVGERLPVVVEAFP